MMPNDNSNGSNDCGSHVAAPDHQLVLNVNSNQGGGVQNDNTTPVHDCFEKQWPYKILLANLDA